MQFLMNSMDIILSMDHEVIHIVLMNTMKENYSTWHTDDLMGHGMNLNS